MEEKAELLRQVESLTAEGQELKRQVQCVDVLLKDCEGATVSERMYSYAAQHDQELATATLTVKNETWRAYQAEQEVSMLKQQLETKVNTVLILQKNLADLDELLQVKRNGGDELLQGGAEAIDTAKRGDAGE